MIRLLALLAGLGLAGTTAHVLAPKPDLYGDRTVSQRIYDRNGELLRVTLSQDDRYRLRVPLSDISPTLIAATLLQEDQAFWLHPGFNPGSLVRAAWETYGIGARRIGGSTITMQLARMCFGLRSRTLAGKLEQILRAVQIELHYSKSEILEAYFTRVGYGGNIESAEAASLLYFGKRARDLNLEEALALAVVPPSPSRRWSASARPDDELVRARDRLLARWRDAHPEQSDELAVLEQRNTRLLTRAQPFRAPHWTNAVLQADRRTQEITTTIDIDVQEVLERAIDNYVERRRDEGLRNAAALLLHYPSMEIRAAVGSADYFNTAIQGQNDGTRARRSPGSTVKPFIYALAMDQGLVHPATVLKDVPTVVGEYDPENFDREFTGLITARDALLQSRNVPALRLAAGLRQPDLYALMQELGVEGLRSREYYGLALALGGVEMSMQDLVRGYALLANGGVLRPIRRRLEDPVATGAPLLSAEAAGMVLGILRDHPRPDEGYAGREAWGRLPVAWKTGTSNGYRDAWTVGVAGPYVLAVWVGEFDNRGNPVFVGVRSAAPLFFEIVDGLAGTEAMSEPAATTTAQLTSVRVCAVSGKLPGPHCAATALTEFAPGRSPIDECDVHRLAAGEASVETILPSDARALLPGAARISNDSAPTAGSRREGHAPEITSPRAGVVYSIRAAGTRRDTLPFVAAADGDANTLYWFVDEALEGTSRPSEPLAWRLRPGTFVVRAVDSKGRVATRRLSVEVVP